ncbi:MAG: ATP-binding protein [Verrucomicrobiota bacterium]
MPKLEIPPIAAKIAAVVFSAMIFFIDWFTPISINISVFYASVLVILAWTLSPRWIWGWAAVSVVLTLIAALATGQSYERADGVNRAITVCMLAVTALFVHFSIIVSRQLEANRRLLAAIEERKRAEESLRKAQEELARISRVTTMGELAASIAHEVNQPLSGIVINGNACLRWLSRIASDSPSLEEARQATERIIRDGKRAGDIVSRLRSFFKRSSAEKARLDINGVLEDVIVLVRHDLERKGVNLRTELQPALPVVTADPVQLQQVVLNLILNGAEAMNAVCDRPRDLTVRTGRGEDGAVRVEVQDAGIGIDAARLDSIFDAFYTTKPGGMGMGLSISRSIIENHGGRLVGRANDGPGATFSFTLAPAT